MTLCENDSAYVAARRSDAVTLLRAWLNHPLRTAAIAPSGPALARLITKDINANERVVELGPGTGVFTHALLARGVQPSRVTVVESNPEFANLLRRRYRNVHVVCADAATDPWGLTDHTEIDAVVSGLPLLSMTAGAVAAVLTTAVSALSPQGRFYQFTYGPTCPVRTNLLDRLNLRSTRIGWTPRNLPPASVYRIERRNRRFGADDPNPPR
ncbi:methyltransferase domain-containing protein [Mycobacterium sp. MBM]|nr:methyltransferase domain-containing protein [Mycobacterium sp. MBM]